MEQKNLTGHGRMVAITHKNQEKKKNNNKTDIIH